MLGKEEFASLEKAGRIAAQALEYGRKLVKKDITLLEVTERIEEKIAYLGGDLAFPVNMSCNSAAAHCAAAPDDTTLLTDQVLKLDVGVSVNGWIGDTAVTVDLSGRHAELVKASREALNKVIKLIKPGITLNEIGKCVEDTITGMGFQPIRNLSGHEVGNYVVHTGLSIPNYPSGEKKEIKDGMIIAIEPFATTGVGLIHEQGNPEIFSIPAYKPVRIGFVRDIVHHLETTYKHMPFSRRSLIPKFSLAQINYTISSLKSAGMVRSYPPLVEQKAGMVSQAEHTMYINENKAVILTKED